MGLTSFRPLLNALRAAAPDLLLFAGSGCVLWGVACWSRPAALILAGLLLFAAAYRLGTT